MVYQSVSVRPQSATLAVHIVHSVLLRIILLGVREGVTGLPEDGPFFPNIPGCAPACQGVPNRSIASRSTVRPLEEALLVPARLIVTVWVPGVRKAVKTTFL
jgi:hypothetical protein